MTYLINEKRLWERVNKLAEITVPEKPWTRRAFTPLFNTAREWLKKQMTLAGLTVTLDPGGNLIGTRVGTSNKLKPIVIGSHCDTVVSGGCYDGIIGVLAGIEVAHCLYEQNIALQHPLEIIDFLSEEPSDYGISCVGSRALVGKLSEDMLSATNIEGETLSQAITRIGGQPSLLNKPIRTCDSVFSYLELHIEQGPVLEYNHLPIGVVTNIVGIHRILLTIEGQADHSGTTPMNIRRDALVGAAHIIEKVHQLALNQSGNPHYVVATIGHIVVHPNASNAIPGQVDMTLEIRSDSSIILNDFIVQLLLQSELYLSQLKLNMKSQRISYSEPTECNNTIMNLIKSAAEHLTLPHMCLPSGAGHDAVYMSLIGPMGMIFIPCLKGRSHCPEESISLQQLADGAKVLGQTLVNLDQLDDIMCSSM